MAALSLCQQKKLISKISLAFVASLCASPLAYANCVATPLAPLCLPGETDNTPSNQLTTIGEMQTVVGFLIDVSATQIDSMRSGDSDVYWVDPKMTDLNAWFYGDWSGFNNDLEDTSYDSDLWMEMVGVDYKIDNTVTVGFAIGYEHVDTSSKFNLGHINSFGYSIMPYANFDIGDGFKFSMNFGYSGMNYDQERLDPVDFSVDRGKIDSDRFFGGLHLAKECGVERYRVAGRIDLFYMNDRAAAYTEEGSGIQFGPLTTRDGRLQVGVTAGYQMNHWIPYVLLDSIWDYTRTPMLAAIDQVQPSNDKTAGDIGFGVSINITPCVVGRVEAKTEFMRNNYDRDYVTGYLRADF